jgi:hypothetical protein
VTGVIGNLTLFSACSHSGNSRERPEGLERCKKDAPPHSGDRAER